MEEYLKQICAPHFWPIVTTIVVMLLFLGAGVALRPLLRKFLDAGIKRLSGEHVEVNIQAGQGDEMPGKKVECSACGLLVNPANCPLHADEHSRSLRNETQILELWKHYEELSKEMRTGFASVQTTLSSSQTSILNNQQRILDAINKK